MMHNASLWNHQLLNAEGSTLLTDKDAFSKGWPDYFDSVPNHLSFFSDNVINRLPQMECNVLLVDFLMVIETTKAIQQQTPGKAPGSDTKSAEIIKSRGQLM